MSIIDHAIESLTFGRTRTLAVLDAVAQLPGPADVLRWRPGPGRAHIGWQLTHIGVTEEIFATERLAPEKTGQWQELWPRFRGGSTPDDKPPEPEEIRGLLEGSRAHLLDTLHGLDPGRLDEVPDGFKQRGFSYRQILWLIAWHEAHHQGQSHITLNLYKAAHA